MVNKNLTLYTVIKYLHIISHMTLLTLIDNRPIVFIGAVRLILTQIQQIRPINRSHFGYRKRAVISGTGSTARIEGTWVVVLGIGGAGYVDFGVIRA